MSRPFRRVVACATVAGVAGAGALVGAAPATSVPADTACPETFPTTELVKDQPVTGLTVSSGSQAEEFSGAVLGVLDNGIGPDLDMIVMRLTSPEIDRVGGIWSGMSGSPVYAEDGRLIGAVSYGLSHGTSPVAGVTPAADMKELLTRESLGSSTEPAAEVALPARLQASMVDAGAATAAEAGSGLQQLAMPLAVSGVPARSSLGAAARRLGLDNVKVYRAGSAPTASAASAEIFAGSNFAASLAYGDFSAIGVGTTTMVCDGKPIGFGHPFSLMGATSLTMHGADAVLIQEDTTGAPFKIANPTGPVGVVDQDRLAGIKGQLGAGAVPETTLIRTHVASGSRSRTGETFVSLPDFTDVATFYAHESAGVRILDKVGPSSALLHYRVSGTADGQPFVLDRTNRFAPNDAIWEGSAAAAVDVGYLIRNEFADVDIDQIDIHSTLSPEPRSFTVGQVRVLRAGAWRTLQADSTIRARAGRLIRLRVVLVSRGNAYGSKVVPVSVRVPARAKPGAAGELYLGEDWRGSYPPEEATSFADLVKRIQEAPRYDEISGNLQLASGRREISVDFRKLAGEVLTGGRNFAVRIMR